MYARLLAAFVTAVIVSAAQAAPAPKSSGEDETPYKFAKVGDTATYKMTMKLAGTNQDGVVTQTVTAKSDKEMTIKTTTKMTLNGMVLPSPDQEHTIDLTKPFDPLNFDGMAKGPTAPTVEKLKEGKEKMTVAGKEYEATWTTYKVAMNPAAAGAPALDAELKVWTSPKAIFHMLKMEITMDVVGMKMEMAMELTETVAKGK